MVRLPVYDLLRYRYGCSAFGPHVTVAVTFPTFTRCPVYGYGSSAVVWLLIYCYAFCTFAPRLRWTLLLIYILFRFPVYTAVYALITFIWRFYVNILFTGYDLPRRFTVGYVDSRCRIWPVYYIR